MKTAPARSGWIVPSHHRHRTTLSACGGPARPGMVRSSAPDHSSFEAIPGATTAKRHPACTARSERESIGTDHALAVTSSQRFPAAQVRVRISRTPRRGVHTPRRVTPLFRVSVFAAVSFAVDTESRCRLSPRCRRHRSFAGSRRLSEPATGGFRRARQRRRS